MPAFIPAAATVASAFISSRGRKGGSPAQESSQNVSGFDALPQAVKNAYLNTYLPDVLSLYNEKKPVTPFNQYQIQALEGMGQNATQIGEELGQYMNPYNKYVTDNIQRQADIQRSNIMGQTAKRGGLGAFGSSALGTQLAGLDAHTARLKNMNDYQNYNQALNFRRQTLGDMLSAGDIMQEQTQEEANAQATRLGQLASFLGAFPGTQTSSSMGIGARQAPVSGAQRFMGGLMGGLGAAQATGLGASLPFDFKNSWTGGMPWKMDQGQWFNY